MSNELSYDHNSGATLYAARFQLNGDVFLTSGASDEVWGTGGRTAADYDVEMPEKGSSGHYVGDFDGSSNIAAGDYPVTVYLQAGGSPANSDRPLGRGVMYWDGTAEINTSTISSDIDEISDGINKELIELGPGE